MKRKQYALAELLATHADGFSNAHLSLEHTAPFTPGFLFLFLFLFLFFFGFGRQAILLSNGTQENLKVFFFSSYHNTTLTFFGRKNSLKSNV